MRWPLRKHAIKPTTVTKEHRTARFDNGSDEDENLAAACSRCNFMRGHMDVSLFQSVIEKLFQVSFIKMHWHTADQKTFRFIRKIFLFEVDEMNAFENKDAAIRAVSRRKKYSLDELLASGRTFDELVSLHTQSP